MPDPPWGLVKYINDFIEHIDPRERASLAPISDERCVDFYLFYLFYMFYLFVLFAIVVPFLVHID